MGVHIENASKRILESDGPPLSVGIGIALGKRTWVGNQGVDNISEQNGPSAAHEPDMYS